MSTPLKTNSFSRSNLPEGHEMDLGLVQLHTFSDTQVYDLRLLRLVPFNEASQGTPDFRFLQFLVFGLDRDYCLPKVYDKIFGRVWPRYLIDCSRLTFQKLVFLTIKIAL